MINVPEDPRTPEQREIDRATIARQAEQVERRRNDTDLENEAISRLIGGRNLRPDQDQITLLHEGEGRQLAKTGEVLISAANLTDELRERLIARGHQVEPIEALRNRVFRVLGVEPDRAARTAAFDPIGDESRQQDGCAPDHHKVLRPNFVTPMGIVMKALCGPENTAGPGMTHPGIGPSPNPVKVAVIDTGISAPERTDGWLTGLETSANRDKLDDLPKDDVLDLGAGHGTFTTGVVQQLAPAADITVYRTLQSDGLATELAVALDMVAAAEAGAQILNLSLGFETDDDEEPVALKAAVEVIADEFPDVLMIAAAGNTGRDRKCWPGAFDQVTSVAGLTQSLQEAAWSTRGDWVDCATIGEGVLSTYVVGTEDKMVDEEGPDTFDPPNPWALWTGTSFAAPQVTGAVAQFAENFGISPRDALQQLLAGRASLPGFGQVIQILPPT